MAEWGSKTWIGGGHDGFPELTVEVQRIAEQSAMKALAKQMASAGVEPAEDWRFYWHTYSVLERLIDESCPAWELRTIVSVKEAG